MLALRRKPEWLGNVGLVLFLAFLLGMWWSVPVGAASETLSSQMRNPVVEGNVIQRFEIVPLTM